MVKESKAKTALVAAAIAGAVTTSLVSAGWVMWGRQLSAQDVAMRDMRLSKGLKAFLATRGTSTVASIAYGIARSDWQTSSRFGAASVGLLTDILAHDVFVHFIARAFARLNSLGRPPAPGSPASAALRLRSCIKAMDEARRHAFPAAERSRASFDHYAAEFLSTMRAAAPAETWARENTDTSGVLKAAGITFVGQTKQAIDQRDADMQTCVDVLANQHAFAAFPFRDFYEDPRLCDWQDYLGGRPAECKRRSPRPGGEPPAQQADNTQDAVQKAIKVAVERYLRVSKRQAVAQRWPASRKLSSLPAAEVKRLIMNFKLEAHPDKNPDPRAAENFRSISPILNRHLARLQGA